MFKVGDRVRIRQWNDMVRDGKIKGGNICLHGGTFVKRMRHLCGREATVSELTGCGYRLKDWSDASGGTCWGYSEEMLEPAYIYATALMEAIRKDPAAYEGKRYEVVGGSVTHWSERYSTIEVGRDYNTENDMTLLCVDENGVTTPKLAMITNREQLREIKPAPKPVSFMEAANSGKEIKHEDWSEFYPLGGALENMTASNAYARKLLNDKKWLIKED